MAIITPEEVEGLRRAETINAGMQAAMQRAGIASALRGGSYPDDASGDGYFDDDTGEWVGYLKYDIDAYNSGLGMAP